MTDEQYVNLDYSKDLVFYDASKVELRSFTPPGKTSPIHFFMKRGNGNEATNIPSRSAWSSRREPFKVSPETQILVDNSVEYGIRVDNDIERFVTNDLSKVDTSTILQETLDTFDNIKARGLIWAGRSIMICHPDSLIYGEIDELLYDPKTDTYYVGDTKTSSSVDKVGYWYQLAMYIEILSLLNPGKKFSPIAIINWVKYKYFSWIKNTSESESEWEPNVDSTHPRYNAIWSKGAELSQPEQSRKEIVERDLEAEGMLDLVRKEFKFQKRLKEEFPNEFNAKQAKVVEVIDQLWTTRANEPGVDIAMQVDELLQKEYLAFKAKYEK